MIINEIKTLFSGIIPKKTVGSEEISFPRIKAVEKSNVTDARLNIMRRKILFLFCEKTFLYFKIHSENFFVKKMFDNTFKFIDRLRFKYFF